MRIEPGHGDKASSAMLGPHKTNLHGRFLEHPWSQLASPRCQQAPVLACSLVSGEVGKILPRIREHLLSCSMSPTHQDPSCTMQL